MNKENLNQTQFVTEEPLFEEKVQIAKTGKKDGKISTKKNKSSKILLVLGLSFFIFIILVLILFLRVSNGNRTIIKEEIVEEIEKVETEKDPMDQRMDYLKVNLKEADPNKKELNFPPVNLLIQLDEPDK